MTQRSALLGVFRDYEAQYNTQAAPARVRDESGGVVMSFDVPESALATMRVNLEARGSASARLPEQSRAAGVTERVTVTCFEPTRLPDALGTGADLIISELDCIVTVKGTTPDSLDVVVDALGQTFEGALSRGAFIHHVTLQAKTETASYGAGRTESWADVGTLIGHVRATDSSAEARFMQAGYPIADYSVSFRDDVTLELGSHRLVYAGKILEPVSAPMMIDQRGAVLNVRCKHAA